MKREKNNALKPYFFVAPSVFVFFIFVILPIFMTFIYSFFHWNGFGEMKFIGLNNYIRLTGDKIYIKSYINTFLYIIITIITEVFVGLILAAIVDTKFKVAIIFRTAFFAPVMLPGVVIGLLWAFVLNDNFGLLNSVLRLIGADNLTRSWLGDPATALIAISFVSGWVFSGYYMTILYAAFQRIPKELFEAASIDGAGFIRQFFCIKLPLTADMVKLCLLLCITGAFQGFDLFYVMTNGGPYHSTEIVTTWLVRTVFNNMDVGYGAALSVVLTIVVLAIAALGKPLQSKNP